MGGDKRKTLVAREDVINKVSEIAKENGRSLYETVNEILELFSLASSQGISFRNAIEEQGTLKRAKDRGLIFGLENLWFDMAEIAFASSPEEAQQSWKEAGSWLAKGYLTSSTSDPFEEFRRDMEVLTWSVSELNVIKKGDEVFVDVLGPKLTEAYLWLLLSFLSGALEVLGYKLKEQEISRGHLRMRATANN